MPSTKFDINDLMARLAKKRKVFHSEADFQHALAWQIRETSRQSKVRLEVDITHEANRRRYFDIWLPDDGIAIELKYSTRKMGDGVLRDREETFALRNQSAEDNKRYDFLSDIERLEGLKSNPQFKAGYAVLLTNNHLFWEPPPKKKPLDAAFRIHEGRRIPKRSRWGEDLPEGSRGARDSTIKLGGDYECRWQEYSCLSDQKSHNTFKYLAVEVH